MLTSWPSRATTSREPIECTSARARSRSIRLTRARSLDFVARVLFAIVILLAADVALATPGAPRDGNAPEGRHRQHRSRSIGFPWRGRVQDAALLEESRTVRYAGEYRDAGHFYATTEMVQLLQRSAAHVARRLPGGKLTVGELSDQHGGMLAGHRSHENGRDVDIGFYMSDPRGRPYDPFAFAVFGADGVGRGPNRMLRFDDARNWELVRRLVTDPDARVQHVFVSRSLRTRLLREGHRRRAPAIVMHRAETVMIQPTHGHPHDNHFHLRIYCDPRDRPRCRDRAPFHAWYPGTPPERDVEGEGVSD